MKLPVFSIHDSLIGYGTPFTDHNEAVAERGFRNSLLAVLDGKVESNQSPTDLSLYRIGEFDTELGDLTSCIPKLICSGLQIVTSWNVDRKDNSYE